MNDLYDIAAPKKALFSMSLFAHVDIAIVLGNKKLCYVNTKRNILCSQNQAGVCIPVLWAIGQSGKTDLATGIKGKKIYILFSGSFHISINS